MKITLVPGKQLTSTLVDAWSEVQRSNAFLNSPFFRPEFTQAVAAVRSDVEVAVVEKDGQLAGFFPFQRTAWNIGKPVGGRLNDFHGIVATDDLVWSADELLRGCRLSAWDFDHLLATQRPFQAYHWETKASPYMDLSGGFDAYHAERRRAGTESIRETRRKARKLQREIGTLRFVPHTAERHVLESLVRWKSDQYRRTGVTNVFAFPWTMKLLDVILDHGSEGFSGMVSALYTGDRLAAVHFGIRSGAVLHSWFPAYDPGFSAYSPGLIMFVELAQAAPLLGIQRVDFGCGEAIYKTSLMSDATLVAQGSAIGNPVTKMIRRSWHHTKTWMKSSPLRAPALLAGRSTRSLRGWLAFR